MDRPQEPDEPLSMASVIEQMDSQERGEFSVGPRRGEMVEGTITTVDRDGILIDIGGKSEAEVALAELPGVLAGAEAPRVGDQVLAYVISTGNREGRYVVSLNRGREERAWRNVQHLVETGGILEAPVTEANRGGIVVNVQGLRGFVPLSQIASVRISGTSEEELAERLRGLIGHPVHLKVVEAQPRRGRLILSERQAAQQLRSQRRQEMIAELREGEVRRGRVTSLTEFGAFVDVGGADGLVHLSEISWARIARPADALSVGDDVDVLVLSVDRERGKIGLSIRRTRPEPWNDAAHRYHPGVVVEGTVTRLATFGAFVQLDDGIEGLIHISEMSDGRIQSPGQVVREGERRRLRILRVDPARHRLALSLKGIPSLVEPADGSETDHGGGYTSPMAAPTIGDSVGWPPPGEGEEPTLA